MGEGSRHSRGTQLVTEGAPCAKPLPARSAPAPLAYPALQTSLRAACYPLPAMRVHRITSLMASSYLLEADRLFLVDAGYVGHDRAVLRTIREIGRSPRDLELVVVTHGHLDHFGGLAALRDEADFTVVSHPASAGIVSAGGKTYSPGRTLWTRHVAWLARTSLPYLTYRGAGPVAPVADGDPLHGFGLPGRVLHTPGHTTGCLSLMLDDGTAFTGDLVTTRSSGNLPSLPSMAVSHAGALDSWHRLLEAGARDFMPGHGRGCTSAELAEAAAAVSSSEAA